MALQSFGTNVTMSASDINVELGNDSTAQLDFQTAGQSFAGIRNVETTEGYGALTVEFREFFGKTFSAGSGTYGTRNSHVLRFLSDDGSLRAYGGGELVFAAEAVVSPVSINGTVSTFNVSKSSTSCKSSESSNSLSCEVIIIITLDLFLFLNQFYLIFKKK